MKAYNRSLAHLKAILANPIDYMIAHRSKISPVERERWEDPLNFALAWDERTQLIAGLIPDGARVIEFGAGREVLRAHLGARCSYQPSDLVPRSESTLVIDLNGILPELPAQYDCAVFSGVLEYVLDIDRVLNWLTRFSNRVIFSYAVVDLLSDPITRRKNGWINSLSDDEIREKLDKLGFSVAQSQIWDGQIVYDVAMTALSPPVLPDVGLPGV
jgi:hypothetical protein